MMKFGYLKAKTVRLTVNQVGIYCIVGGIAQGVIEKDVTAAVAVGLTLTGIVLCLGAAYRKRKD